MAKDRKPITGPNVPAEQRLSQRESERVEELQVEIHTYLGGIKTNIFQIGRRLSEAKQILGHGRFQTWIEETFDGDLSYSTANHYRGIYDEYRDNEELVKKLPLTTLIAMKKKDFPEDKRKDIEADPDHYAKMGQKEFKEETAPRKDAKENDKGRSRKSTPTAGQAKSGGQKKDAGADGPKDLRGSLTTATRLVKEALKGNPQRDQELYRIVLDAITALNELKSVLDAPVLKRVEAVTKRLVDATMH